MIFGIGFCLDCVLAAKGRRRSKEESPHTGGALPQGSGIALIVGALGVVFGDIGTSPLYAMREVFFGPHPLSATPEHVLGAASLVFWSLIIVVTVKYVGFVLRADNHGEGGIFALLGLLMGSMASGSQPQRPPRWLLAAILIATSLLYGEGVITPAISVLSAVEGLSVVAPAADHLRVPVTLLILAGLFALQSRGTGRIGRLFGPVMVIWFVTIAALGIWRCLEAPEVFLAVNPVYAARLISEGGLRSLLVFGAVVLCVTGVEAMYADMGHFGRAAVSRAWLFLVLPCLLANYFGQAAYLLSGREVPDENLFYAMAPSFGAIPLLILATFATIIASQALISGAFSLTQQAVALGFFPRVKVVHTNPDMPGQIYMPFINFMLFAGCSYLVLSFRTSSALAAAYGLAVTGTMMVTTIAFSYIAVRVWGWKKVLVIPLAAMILLVDVTFFVPNALKFATGGYIPVIIGFIVYTTMDAWRFGRQWIGAAYQRRGAATLTLKEVLDSGPDVVEHEHLISLVVMASRPVRRVEDTVPPVFAVHFKNWKRIPKYVLFFTAVQTASPFVLDDERFEVLTLHHSERCTVVSVVAYYGYMEHVNVRRSLAFLKSRQKLHIPLESRKWLILLGAERFVTRGRNPLERLRLALFSRLNRLAKPVTDYFGLETDMGVTTETINV